MKPAFFSEAKAHEKGSRCARRRVILLPMPFLLSLPWSRARNEKKKPSDQRDEIGIERTIVSMPCATADGRCPRCGGRGIVPNSGRRFNPFLSLRSPGHMQCDDCGLEFERDTGSQAEPRVSW